MKVILLSDVTKVGKKYDIVDVAPGYARNFLLARGLGEAVTQANARRVAEMTKKREVEKKQQDERLAKSLAGVGEAVVTLTRNANEEGHLYAGVTKEELAEALNTAVGAAFTEDHIMLDKPLKAVGEFNIVVALNGKEATFKVQIEATKED